MRLRPGFIASQLNQTTIAFTSQQDSLLHKLCDSQTSFQFSQR
jgi:hypothetical protein